MQTDQRVDTLNGVRQDRDRKRVARKGKQSEIIGKEEMDEQGREELEGR